MFCEKCGSKIPDGSAFCPNCGSKAAAAAVKKEAAKAAEVVKAEADSTGSGTECCSRS